MLYEGITDCTVTLAVFATTTSNVEGESTRLVAPGLRLGQGGEQLPDHGEDTHVGGGI